MASAIAFTYTEKLHETNYFIIEAVENDDCLFKQNKYL